MLPDIENINSSKRKKEVIILERLLINEIRKKKPLIHHITNYVTVYDCAQAVLSCGALPVMADAVEECAEMTGYADALVLNIGTLNSLQIASMIESGKSANNKGIPIVLDPVGAGATKFRRDTVEKLLKEIKIDVIKGNAAEIALVAGSSSRMKGVESIGNYEGIGETAIIAAKATGSVIIVTGRTDIVTDGNEIYEISNGHETMGKIVGTGCMSASVIASHCTVEKNYALAASQALSIYGLAGEKAAAKSKSPMMFKTYFMDALFETNDEDIKSFKYICRSL